MEQTSRLLVFENGVPEIAAILSELNWDEQYPFLTIVTDEKSIKIEHVRDLQVELGTRSPDQRRVLIAPGEKITLPAQQALLKLLEEPPENTSVVIAVQSPQALLPTIQSRCVIIRAAQATTQPAEAVLWSKWQAAKSLREKVELTQQFSGKKDEVARLLQQEVGALLWVPATKESVAFRQRLLESLEAVQGNVSPQLCLEKLLLS